MPRFAKIIDDTRALLNDPANTEWVDRYQEYAKILSESMSRIENQRSKFNVPAPFYAYITLTNAKSTGIKFQLRYLGQIVAELRYDSSSDNLLLSTASHAKQNRDNFDFDQSFDWIPWLSSEAKEFRAHFKRFDEFGMTRIDGSQKNEEHRLESALYAEFEKGSAASKVFNGIQPVRFGKVRMGFPTPLGASRHGMPKYGGDKGGNVDILVRWGIPKSTLCVIELKDENKKRSESPCDVVEQATIYAVFLRELLRSPSGRDWWRLFGFSRKLPEKLHIDAMSLMPRGVHDDTAFCGSEYRIDDDCIQLHAAFFMERSHFQYRFVR